MTEPPNDEPSHAFTPIGWETQTPLDVRWWQSMSHERWDPPGTPSTIEAVLYVRDNSWSLAARLPHSATAHENLYRLRLRGAEFNVQGWEVTPPGSAEPYLQVQIETSRQLAQQASNGLPEARSFVSTVERLLELVKQVADDTS